MSYYCNMILDTEEERDSFVNLLGRTLILLEKKLTEELSDEEEIALIEIVEDGFSAIGKHFEKLAREIENDQMRGWQLGYAET